MSDPTNNSYTVTPLIKHRVQSLESDVEGINEKCDEIIKCLHEIRSDMRSVSESRERDDERLKAVEERQQETGKKITKWAVPMGVLIMVMTAATIAALTGVDLNAIF